MNTLTHEHCDFKTLFPPYVPHSPYEKPSSSDFEIYLDHMILEGLKEKLKKLKKLEHELRNIEFSCKKNNTKSIVVQNGKRRIIEI